LKKIISSIRSIIFGLQQKPLSSLQILSIVGSIIFCMIVAGILIDKNSLWLVKAGDRPVAVIADKAAAQRILAELNRKIVQEYGWTASLSGQVSFERVGKENGPAMDMVAFEQIIAKEVKPLTMATAIFVNGEKKLVVADREIAGELLSRLKGQYSNDTKGPLSFAEDVEIKEVCAGIGEILTLDSALAAINKGAGQERAYRVKEGDTLWDIAKTAKLDIKKLYALNPGLSPERLQIGQVVYISSYSPLINVIATVKLNTREDIPFPVEEKEDRSLFQGQSRVLQKGKPGEKAVTYIVTYRNNLEESRRVEHEEILREPAPQIVAKGTRQLLASRSGSPGRLMRPVAGPVLSPFGTRGAEFHAGIDIGARANSAVSAAGEGRVIRAGWYGGYGNCVEISHAGGIVTRYGHLSSIAVKVGQNVSRGQLIGRVGSTGNSTGPHLHFEVIVGGRLQNPLKYL